MSIKKLENGRFRSDVWPEGRTGKRVRKTFDKHGDAKAWEAEIRAKANRGEEWKPKPKDTRRLSQLFQAWYDGYGVMLRDGKGRLGKLLKFADEVGDPLAINFSSNDFVQWRKGKLAAEPPLTVNTINHYHRYISAAFKELIRQKEWATESPMKGFRQASFRPREMSYLEHDEIRALLDALDRGRNRDVGIIARICLATGARWGEASSLRGEHVKQNRVTFVDTKNNRSRTVPISAALSNQIFDGRDSFGPLFGPSYDAFKEGLDRSGLILMKGQRTHILRHTFASHFIMSGGDLLTLQKILGHEVIAMTMKYAHLAPDHLADAVKYNPLAKSGLLTANHLAVVAPA